MFLTIILLVLIFVFYTKWKHTYWQRKGLEYEEPTFFFGNIKELFLQKCSYAEYYLPIYKNFKKRGLTCGGLYSFLKPTCMIVDPELIKRILITDFAYFQNRGLYVNEKHDSMSSASLFLLEYDKWRRLRTKLTPPFTTNSMKMMFDTFVDCTKGLEEKMKKYADLGVEIDVKDVLACFTTDVIGSCAFGLDCNSMINPDCDFRKYGKRVFQPKNFREKINPFLSQIFPTFFLDLIRYKYGKVDVEQFFESIVRQTVEYRENHNIFRKDFMHLLIQLKNIGELNESQNVLCSDGKKREVALTMSDLISQSYSFFMAAFETSSTTMSFALYEIAANQCIQEKLRKEIRTVLSKYDGKLTFDGISEMTYMQQIIDETLRKYPPIPVLLRSCTAPYKIPGTSVTIEPGTRLMIPLFGIQNDPDYYPQPDMFDPERFNEENKSNHTPFTYLPFGGGPRICIGLRFGMLESKVGLVSIIKDFNVSVSNRMSVPLQYDPSSFIQTVKDGIWLNISKIN